MMGSSGFAMTSLFPIRDSLKYFATKVTIPVIRNSGGNLETAIAIMSFFFDTRDVAISGAFHAPFYLHLVSPPLDLGL